MPQNEQKEINELKDCMVNQLSPLKIYLFGSFADGTQKEDSDYDFYIVVRDSEKDIAGVTTAAYRSVRKIKKRPVDIIVGTESRFEERKNRPTIENEVNRKGILLYEFCYHCQQSAEKVIKALIVNKGSQGGLPRSHDISFLLNQISNMYDIPEEYYDYGDTLSPYGVASRYPHELFLVESNAEQALRYATEIMDWAQKEMRN